VGRFNGLVWFGWGVSVYVCVYGGKDGEGKDNDVVEME